MHDSVFISFKFNQHDNENIQRILRSSFDPKKRIVEILTIEAEKNKLLRLTYQKVFSVIMNFPEKASLFDDYDFLGDWGYDELTIDKNGHLQHEILFSTGATIKIIFEIFNYRFLSKSKV